MRSSHMQTFHGVWPALITPATPEGAVSITVLRELTEYLLDKGVDGFYLCGTTGEGLWLSVLERQQVLETVMAQVRGRVPVIVHVGAMATRDAVTLAQHAATVGADGVSSVLPPVLNQPEHIMVHYTAIARVVPSLPFFAYVFGGETDAVTLMRDLLDRLPNVGGAKYTGPNMQEFRQLVDLKTEGWTVFSGMDQQCVFAAMFGSSGNIGSTLNFMPGVYKEIHRCCRDGDLARARDLQLRANLVMRAMRPFGFLGALREVMRILGFDCGEPRLPHLPLPADQRGVLRDALAATDFDALVAM